MTSFKHFISGMMLCTALLCGCGEKTADITPGQDAVRVPFAGNSYVSSCAPVKADASGIAPASRALISAAAECIDTGNGRFISWNDRKTVLSSFMKASAGGEFRLFADVVLPAGTSSGTLAFSCGGQKREVKIKESGCVYVGDFSIPGPGYFRIDVSGDASPAGAQFARVKDYLIEGDVLGEGSIYVPEEELGDCYWYRRGPSVHLNYTLPAGKVEWFYNEVEVPVGADVPDTYYMLTGFGEGYMGIQTHDNGPNSVLFSVWSPFETDNPKEIPDEYRVVTLRKGAGVTAQDFGDEGSGGQSFMDFNWETGKVYRTLVHVRPDGKGNTEYTGYFGDDKGQWYLLASFRRPHTDTWYTRAHSFLECFCPETSIWTREVRFRNQWAIMDDGQAVEVTGCRFTCDNTGRKGMRADMAGGLDGTDFMLRNCGFFDDMTSYGSTYTREAQGNAPTIDFAALEQL